MSLIARNFLLIHVNHFKQLDHYFKSVYKLNIKTWVEGSDDLNKNPLKKNYYNYSTSEFSTIIYQNTQLDEIFHVCFESKCFPEFDCTIYIEVEFCVKGIQSKKFPQDKDGYSSIGKNLLRIKNPFKTFHEYIEVVFDDLICAVVSFGIHSSLVSYEFVPKTQNSLKNKNEFFKTLNRSKNLSEYLSNLTNNGEVEHVDAFYSDYAKILKLSAEELLSFIVNVFKTLMETENGSLSKNQKNFDKLRKLKQSVQGINLPYSSQFTHYVTQVKKQNSETLNSKFNFRQTEIDHKKMLQTVTNFDEEPKKVNQTNKQSIGKEKGGNYFEQIKIKVEKKKIQKFEDSAKVFQIIENEMKEFSRYAKFLFQILKDLISYSGEEINQELRVDFHAKLKDRYLDNILTDKIEVNQFYQSVEKEYKDTEIAKKFRNKENHKNQFQAFKVDNLTLFDHRKIKPVFFEQIASKKQKIKSLIKMESIQDIQTTQRSNLYLNMNSKKSRQNIQPNMQKSFITMKVDKTEDTHLIIMVHGYQGSDYDL